MESPTAQVDLITISAPVEREFDYRVRLAVVERRLPSKAEAIRQALEQWLNTPQRENGESDRNLGAGDGKES